MSLALVECCFFFTSHSDLFRKYFNLSVLPKGVPPASVHEFVCSVYFFVLKRFIVVIVCLSEACIHQLE